MKAICTLSLTLILSGELLAKAPERERKEQMPERGAPSAEMLNHIFQRLDTDKSGKISPQEFEANPRLERASEEQKKKLFQRLDKNGDGQLQRNELKHEKPPTQRNWHTEGPLTFEKFAEQPRVAKLPPQAQRDLFERMDRNDDGKIDKEDRRFNEGGRPPRARGKERPGGPPSHGEIDRNKDGKVTFEEFQNAPFHKGKNEDEVEDLFESLDRNGDAVLTPDERPEKPGEKSRPPSAPPLF